MPPCVEPMSERRAAHSQRRLIATAAPVLPGAIAWLRERWSGVCERKGTGRPAWLASLRPIYVRRLAEEDFGRLHHGLGERRVRMDRELEVGGVRAHLDREHTLGDQLTGARTDEAHAEPALARRIENQFRQAVGAIERDRTA